MFWWKHNLGLTETVGRNGSERGWLCDFECEVGQILRESFELQVEMDAPAFRVDW